MPFVLEIMPSALAELKSVKIFYRRAIAQAIEDQLLHQPTTQTKNRKLLAGAKPSFEFEPPLWELRIGDFRVYFDVNEEAHTVYIRAIREKPPHTETEEII